MTLTEVLGLGDLVCLAADEWAPTGEPTGLRCMALATNKGRQVANIVVDPDTRRVWVLELVEDSVTAQWQDPDLVYEFPGQSLTSTQALTILAELLAIDHDPT